MKYEVEKMHYQYREFVQKISIIEEKDGSEKLSSLDLITMMMNTKAETWKGCEATMDVCCQAATKKTVESVVESWVSILEHHSSKVQNLKAETIQHEMMVAVNGPLIQHSQQMVDRSMKSYWGRLKKESLHNGHFTRHGSKVKSYTISKTVDTLNSAPVKTVFMV